MSPLLDVLMTLLHLGSKGWAAALSDREELYVYARERLQQISSGFSSRVLDSPGNPISIAVSLKGVNIGADIGDVDALPLTFLGSMLWSRCVSGTRVIAPGKTQIVAGTTFEGYGSSYDDYPSAYLTAAAAIGTTRAEVDEFCVRLAKCVKEFQQKARVAAAKKNGDTQKLKPQDTDSGGGRKTTASDPEWSGCDEGWKGNP